MKADDVPVIGRQDVILLFHWSFWDYPRSGALQWKGLQYWFVEEVGLIPEGREGVFHVLDLSPEDWERVEKDQGAFEKYVGMNTRYDPETQKRSIGDLRPIEEWGKFYDNRDTAWQPLTGKLVAIMRWEGIAAEQS